MLWLECSVDLSSTKNKSNRLVLEKQANRMMLGSSGLFFGCWGINDKDSVFYVLGSWSCTMVLGEGEVSFVMRGWSMPIIHGLVSGWGSWSEVIPTMVEGFCGGAVVWWLRCCGGCLLDCGEV